MENDEGSPVEGTNAPEPDELTAEVAPAEVAAAYEAAEAAETSAAEPTAEVPVEAPKKKKKTGKTAPTPKFDPEELEADAAPAPEPEPPLVTAEPVRARTATVVAGDPVTSRPPPMPTEAAPVELAMGGVEDPTHLPDPAHLPAGHPNDPAGTPGFVPPGDSRSLRRGDDYALIYRRGTYVVTRVGTVGTRGVWRATDYPTPAFASHSYARECSRFVSEGYSDYRG